MNIQLTLFEAEQPEFMRYHIANPEIYSKFKELTLQTIRRGFKNYGAKGIFELIRWHHDVKTFGEFKINNNYTPLYARLFEIEHPEYKGFFRKRGSKFDKLLKES